MRYLLLELLLVAAFASITWAQPGYSICGNVKSETLTIPSYRFIVVDKDGKRFEDLHITGELLITEHRWGHNFGDWNWEQINHTTPIAVSYDEKEGVYVSAEVPRVKIAFRKGFRKSNCLDRLEWFDFLFTIGADDRNSRYSGGLHYNFENRPLEQIQMPDSSKPIKIILKNWDWSKALN